MSKEILTLRVRFTNAVLPAELRHQEAVIVGNYNNRGNFLLEDGSHIHTVTKKYGYSTYLGSDEYEVLKVIASEKQEEIRESNMEQVNIVEQIRKDLGKAEGPYPVGTIISWVSVHPVNGARFHYAAIFANNEWYTTVVNDNTNVQRKMSHEKLMKYLVDKGENLTDIKVATKFDEI